jgi:WD40 repeat protein
MVSCAKDGKILAWDTRKSGRDAITLCLDWQQDYTAIAKPYHKARKRILANDVTSYRKISNIDNIRAHESPIMCVKYTECGRYILSFGNDKSASHAREDGLVRCWNSHDGALLPTQYDVGCVSNLSYDVVVSSSSGSNKSCHDILITPSYHNSIAVVNIHSNGKPKVILAGHIEQVTSIVYRKYYQQIISSSKDGNILIWNTKQPSATESNEWEREGAKVAQRHRPADHNYVPPIIRNYLHS